MKALEYLRRTVRQLLVRGVITLTKDSSDIQELQIATYSDDVTNGVERFSEFGFSSNVPKNSECIVVTVGASKEHSVVVATNHRKSRPKDLAQGATKVYDEKGNYVHFKNTGEIEVVASSKVVVTAPEAEFSGNVTIKGNLTVDGTSKLKGVVTADADVNVGANANVTGNAAVTGNVTAAGVTASGAVAGSAIAAPSITVAGQELSGYAAHTHSSPAGGNTGAPN